MGIEEKWARERQIYHNLAQHLKKHVQLQPEWFLLEFGIGNWGFGRFYQECVGTVYGVDIEDYPAAIRRASSF